MATKLKIVEETSLDVGASSAPLLAPPEIPGPHQSTTLMGSFAPAPSRNTRGWSAERQRKFIEHLALTGAVGEASAVAGVSSRSAYRLRNKAGAESFAAAWDAALRLAATRLAAIAFDRAINGRAERIYKDGELVAERRVPSDYLLTWLLGRLDPVQFGHPAARAAALAASDNPRHSAAEALPALTASLADVAPEECACEPGNAIDHCLGEMAGN
jgi:hypothetical protein